MNYEYLIMNYSFFIYFLYFCPIKQIIGFIQIFFVNPNYQPFLYHYEKNHLFLVFNVPLVSLYERTGLYFQHV